MTTLTNIGAPDPLLQFEITPENVLIDSCNTMNGSDMRLQIKEVRSLSNDDKLEDCKAKLRILQKKGDRSTFLKRLGMTNKSLYEEYLQFKKKNNGKPIVGTKSNSKTKYITPSKYKKPEHKASNKEAVNLPKNNVLQKPLSTNSIAINSNRAVFANNSVKKPVKQILQFPNLPRTTIVTNPAALSNIQPLIALKENPVVPSLPPSTQPFTLIPNTITTPLNNSISKTSLALNKSLANGDINSKVKLTRLNGNNPEPDPETIIYIDEVDEFELPFKTMRQSNNQTYKSRATENASQLSSKSLSKRIDKTIALNNNVLGLPLTSSTPKKALDLKRMENTVSQGICLLPKITTSSTTMSTDPLQQKLLMQPQSFGNMKTKSEMGQYIKEIQETITAINGVIGVPANNNNNNNKIVMEPRYNITVGQTQTGQKTFRDKATMAKDKKQFNNINKRLSRIQKKNEMLRMKIKNMQKQLNERKKPLYEQVDKIEEMKKEGNMQAIFLMEQINNFDKKMVKFSFENMTIFTVLQKRSQKGYQFLQHHNILGMPSRSTISRFLNKDGNFQEKYVDEHIND